MPNPVVVNFMLAGIQDVQRAFRTVEQSAAASERVQVQARQRGVQQRVSLADKEARDKVRAMLKADAELRKAQDKATRDVERAARERQKIEQKAAQDKVRAMHRADAEQKRAQDRSIREADRAAHLKVKAEEKAERQRVREVERSEQRIRSIRERSASMAGRLAARQAAQEMRERERAAREHAKFARGIADRFGSGIGAGVSRVSGLAQRTAGLAVQLGGGFSMADVLQERANAEREAAFLANNAESGGARPAVKDIMKRADEVSAATGIDTGELIKGMRGFVAKSADFKGGMENLDFFAKVAKATGTPLEDVMKTAGILRVQNKDLGSEEMKQLILTAVGQGKLGSVEFEDLARVAGKVTRTSSSFQGSQADNQAKLLGLAQIGMRTTGSADEAATVISNLSADTMKHRDKILPVIGQDMMDAQGRIKSPEELIARVLEKTGGNMAKIQDMGFGGRSMKMFQALAPTFQDAESRQRGSGKQAVLDEIKEVTLAGYDENKLTEDFKNIIGGPADQFEKAMRDLKNEIGRELLPEFVKLVPQIKELTPTIVKLLKEGLPAITSLLTSLSEFAVANRGIIEGVAKHPVGALIAFEVTKSFAAAQLGDLLRTLFTRAIPPPSPVPGGGPTPVPGAAGPGVTAAMVLQGAAFYDLYNDTSGAMDSGRRKGEIIAAGLAAGDPEAARALRTARARSGGSEVMNAWLDRASRATSFLGGGAGIASSFISDKITGAMGYQTGGERARQALEAKEIVDTVELKRATTQAIAEGVKQGVQQGMGDAPRGAGIVQRTQ